MNAGLEAVVAALDIAASPVDFFLRDDDAGWDDARLFALLRCVERARVPIDLAVIPQAAGEDLARRLCARIDAAPGRVGVHQHGLAHYNHQIEGRKCEFGAARPYAAQRADLRAGRERLRALFGARLDAIFTPPWNRCSAVTPELLAELGYSALSRERSATPQQALPELAVDVDWCKQRSAATLQGDADANRIGFDLARRIGAGGCVGLMLHHAAMDERDLALLDALLTVAAHHPHARWLPMRELIATRAAARAGHCAHFDEELS